MKQEKIKEIALKIRREFFTEGKVLFTEKEAIEFTERVVAELSKKETKEFTCNN
jgi:hypothetical protein